jgi:hypothetical protein
MYRRSDANSSLFTITYEKYNPQRQRAQIAQICTDSCRFVPDVAYGADTLIAT